MKEIYQIIPKLDGNIILIGIKEEKILNMVKENQKINQCYLLNTEDNDSAKKRKKRGRKNFSIKYLRKKFHKKKIDYIICDIAEIYPYRNTFIKDSVYINRRKIYFYGENKFDLEGVINRYQKYQAETTLNTDKKTFLLTVFNENSKTSKTKDFYFMIYDKLRWLYEIIGDILIN